MTTTNYQPRTWRMWAAGFGGRSSLNGETSTGAADLRSHTAGFAIGFDAQIYRTTLAGIAVGYTRSGFSVEERLSSGTVEGAHVGIYGMKQFGPLYFAATAEYAHFSNQTNRNIDWVLDERARGEFASDAYSARLEAGWRRSFGIHRVTPFAGLDVSYLRSDGFVEDSVSALGGPGILGLTVDADSVTSLTSALGVQFDTRVALANGQTLTPFARVAWVHEFNPDRSIHSNLTLSPAAFFAPEGAAAASDMARVRAGARLDVTGRVALFAYFDGEFSSQGQSYAGTGGVRISW